MDMLDLVIYVVLGILVHACGTKVSNSSMYESFMAGKGPEGEVHELCSMGSSIGSLVCQIYWLSLFINHAWYVPILAFLVSGFGGGIEPFLLANKTMEKITAYACYIFCLAAFVEFIIKIYVWLA